MSLWGGRFSQDMDRSAWELNASLSYDHRLAPQDVRASLAWARALEKAGALTSKEAAQLCSGLETIQAELARGEFAFRESDEDIHTAVERRLGELIGPLAGKLHTGRSRNDQVATDFRLWLLESIPLLQRLLADLQAVLVQRAESDMGMLMPGYTHLQRAQPVLLSHWWLSHFWPLQRDRQRLGESLARTASLPLGSGALAGVPYPVDRQALAFELGFAAPSPNSIDAVSDRDFAAEFLFCAALTSVHLSRLSEAVVLFTSAEFGFFSLSDAFATGSSLMPQKKNPDPFELARGKSGALIGSLAGLLATLKSLPSAYDKDLQEDKPPVFAAFDTLHAVFPVLSGALQTLSIDPERMRLAIDAGLMTTDLADYLVAKGVPFRQAHSLVGQVVRLAAEEGRPLEALPLAAYRSVSPAFETDLYTVFDPAQSILRRSAVGGTASPAVQAQLQQAKSLLTSLKD